MLTTMMESKQLASASVMELQFPYLLIASLILLFSLLFSVATKKSTDKLPPGPWKLPLIGNLLCLVGSVPHRALRDLANKHGPLMHLQLGEISAIVVSTPQMAKEVLKTHDIAFANRQELLAARIIVYDNTDVAFAPYGSYWRQMRRICTLELLSAKKVRSFRSIREEEVWHLTESIQSSLGTTINLTEKLYSLINVIICRAVFGKRCKDEDLLIQLIRETIKLGGGFDIADLFPSKKFIHVLTGLRPKLLKIHHKVDKILDDIISERREILASTKKWNNDDTEEEDLIDVLLRLQESSGLELPITSSNVKAVIMDMFSAGTDTSSTTIEWAMVVMIRNPRVMEKAQAKVRQAFGQKKTIVETDIQELSYLNLVIKETLRLHTPLPLLVPRECREERKIGGYNIPMKTKVFVNAWAMGRDPDYWHDAETFIPERFEKSPLDFAGNNLEYIPFGAGRRMCPGVSLGLANVEWPLAALLYHFNWKLPSGIKAEDLDMTETVGAIAGRKQNLNLIANSPSYDLN
ncbi:hypothetical protein RJ639_039996 [Escallonia herrerae]|uniref:Cytochrome P450 n=1 Tax=Escallonia herrerae TaxID=1293975 RepID=A0AA88WMD1_9ASTE|nr:hypothetical protein RJ639_039996 [Escallonia herrerae]